MIKKTIILITICILFSCSTPKNTFAPPNTFISEFGFYKGQGIQFNSVYVTYIPNEKQQVSNINSIVVETKKTSGGSKKQTQMPFIVNIYAVDSIFRIPTTKLISDRIVTQRTSKNIIEIDISKYEILFPKEGIFVSVEPLKVEEYVQKGFKYNIGPSFKYLKKTSNRDYFSLRQSFDEKGNIKSEWGKDQLYFVYNFGIIVNKEKM